MKLVVTGAGGLLGRAVTRCAARQGAQVFGIGRATAPADWRGGDWLAWDMREPLPADEMPAAAGADVLHLAGSTAIRAVDAIQIADAALLARRAADLARRLGGRLIVVSSAAVYSGKRTDYPVSALREDDPVEPRTPYGMAKLAAENAAREALPEACVLRLFSIIAGASMASGGRGHLAESIVRALRDELPLSLVLDAAGRPAVRDYLTPEQFAEIVWRLVRLNAADGRRLNGLTINVGSGVPTTTQEIIALAAEISGRTLAWNPVTKTNAESSVLVADVSRLRELLGFAPASLVKEAVAQLVRTASAC